MSMKRPSGTGSGPHSFEEGGAREYVSVSPAVKQGAILHAERDIKELQELLGAPLTGRMDAATRHSLQTLIQAMNGGEPGASARYDDKIRDQLMAGNDKGKRLAVVLERLDAPREGGKASILDSTYNPNEKFAEKSVNETVAAKPEKQVNTPAVEPYRGMTPQEEKEALERIARSGATTAPLSVDEIRKGPAAAKLAPKAQDQHPGFENSNPFAGKKYKGGEAQTFKLFEDFKSPPPATVRGLATDLDKAGRGMTYASSVDGLAHGKTSIPDPGELFQKFMQALSRGFEQVSQRPAPGLAAENKNTATMNI